MKRIERTGDETKQNLIQNGSARVKEIITESKHNDIWGYLDADMTSEYRNCIEICHPKYDK
jgi:hypothetical protein